MQPLGHLALQAQQELLEQDVLKQSAAEPIGDNEEEHAEREGAPPPVPAPDHGREQQNAADEAPPAQPWGDGVSNRGHKAQPYRWRGA
jgi:hypothetical protein